MKKNIPVWFCVLLLPFVPLRGQGVRQDMADTYFRNMDYYKAAPIYAELARKSVRRHSGYENIRRAALCYRNNFELDKAEYFYRQLQSESQLNGSDSLALISILRMQGKYEEADAYTGSLPAAVGSPELRRASEPGFRQELMLDSLRYQVRDAGLNSDMGDFAPAWYKNGIVYASRRKNTGILNGRYGWDNSWFLNLYYSARKDSARFEKARLMKGIFKTGAHDGPLAFSEDGTEMFIARNRVAGQKGERIVRVDLYRSVWQDGKWSSPEYLPFNGWEFSTGHAALKGRGDTLWFVSDRPGGYGGTDLYYVTRPGGTWTEPRNAGPLLNTSRNEMFPFLSPAGTLYFASDGHPGLGGLDIFRADTRNPGQAPGNMGYPLNTSADDFALITGKTEQDGFFSSNRAGFTDRIYAVQIQEYQFRLHIRTLALYGQTEALPHTGLVLRNRNTGRNTDLQTGESGDIMLPLEAGTDYEILASKEAFVSPGPLQVTTRGLHRNTDIEGELLLRPRMLTVRIHVVDSATRSSMPGVQGILVDTAGREIQAFISDSSGWASVEVPRGGKLKAEAGKKGYIYTRKIFETAIDSKETELELSLARIAANATFRVDNILYDYGLATLRGESKKELDKLAAFLLLNSTIKVELSAHTDSRGSDGFNLQLSRARAAACVDYLVQEKGVPAARIISRGYGETKPLNHCANGIECSEEEYQQNRRTEIRILRLQ